MYKLFSPPHFISLSNKLLPGLFGLFCCLLGYGLIGALYHVPPDYLQGEAFRILYVHAPCAFLSLLVYSCMAVAAILGLVWRLKIAFVAMRECAVIGAMFTALALITGCLWGKPMWGTFWIWDARLTSELILLFLYIGVLTLHSAIENQRSADHATAILVLIGFVDIPIIHYSVNWWNTLHQGATLTLLSPSHIDNSMIKPLFAMIAALICYFAITLILRLRNALIMRF